MAKNKAYEVEVTIRAKILVPENTVSNMQDLQEIIDESEVTLLVTNDFGNDFEFNLDGTEITEDE